MIKHIVLFKLKEFTSEDEKTAKLTEIKTALETLPPIIKEIKSMTVGINCNPNEAFDIALETTFNNLEDLEVYAKHPDHVAAGSIIREVLDSRACVDYEI